MSAEGPWDRNPPQLRINQGAPLLLKTTTTMMMTTMTMTTMTMMTMTTQKTMGVCEGIRPGPSGLARGRCAAWGALPPAITARG